MEVGSSPRALGPKLLGDVAEDICEDLLLKQWGLYPDLTTRKPELRQ
jgi:hypothetical protein